MKRRLGVIGLGRLGKASGEAIVATEDLAVAGIVRRPESLNQPLPAALRGVEWRCMRASSAALIRL